MASAIAVCSLTAHPLAPASRPFTARKTASARPVVQHNRNVLSRASAVDVGMQIAEEAAKVGSVDAPSWVLPAGVVIVTLASILSGFLLKPGDDAARQIQERDAKSGRFK